MMNTTTHWIIWVIGDLEKLEQARDYAVKIYSSHLELVKSAYNYETKITDAEKLVSGIFPAVHRNDSMFVISGDCAEKEVTEPGWRKDFCRGFKEEFGLKAVNLELAGDGVPILNMDSTAIIL